MISLGLVIVLIAFLLLQVFDYSFFDYMTGKQLQDFPKCPSRPDFLVKHDPKSVDSFSRNSIDIDIYL